MPNNNDFIDRLDLISVNKQKAFTRPHSLDNHRYSLLERINMTDDWVDNLARILKQHVPDIDWFDQLNHHLSICPEVYRQYFCIIYGYLSGQLDDVLTPVSNNKQKYFALILEEGINACNEGVLERSQVLVSLITDKPSNLEELLCHVRTQLVHDFANQFDLAQSVHNYSLILFKAKEWLGIQSEVLEAPGSAWLDDEEIKQPLIAWINRYFQFSNWVDLIVQVIENKVLKADSQLDYDGEDFRTHNSQYCLPYRFYDRSRHEQYIDYLRAILDLDASISVLDGSYDENYQFRVIGLNWAGIRQAIWQQLLDQGYIVDVVPNYEQLHSENYQKLAFHFEFLAEYKQADLVTFLDKIGQYQKWNLIVLTIIATLKRQFERTPDTMRRLISPIKQAYQEQGANIKRLAAFFNWCIEIEILIRPLQKLGLQASLLTDKISNAEEKLKANHAHDTMSHQDRLLKDSHANDFKELKAYFLRSLSCCEFSSEQLRDFLVVVAKHLFDNDLIQFRKWLLAPDPYDLSSSRLLVAQDNSAYGLHLAIEHVFEGKQAYYLHQYAIKKAYNKKMLHRSINHSFLEAATEFASSSTFKWLINQYLLSDFTTRPYQLYLLFRGALVKHNSDTELLNLLSCKVDIDNKFNAELLYIAAYQDDYFVLKRLIDLGLRPNKGIENNKLSDIIGLLLRSDDVENIKAILSNFAPLDKQTSYNVLYQGASQGTVEHFKILMSYACCIDVNQFSSGDRAQLATIMANLARSNNKDKLDVLFSEIPKLKEDVLRSEFSVSLFGQAAARGSVDVVNYLFELGFDPTFQSATAEQLPLDYIDDNHDYLHETLRDLICKNQVDFDEAQRRPIQKAIANNDKNEFYRLLADKQVKVDAHLWDCNALHTAAYFGYWEYFEAIWDKVKLTNPGMINQGFMLHERNFNNISPINYIIQYSHLHMLRAINNRPDMIRHINSQHCMGHGWLSPSDYCFAHQIAVNTRAESPEMLEELIKLSLSNSCCRLFAPNIANTKTIEGWYPIHFAAMNTKQGGKLINKMAKFIDVNTQVDPEGCNFEQTPLHIAVNYKNPNAVQALIDNGAAMTQANYQGEWFINCLEFNYSQEPADVQDIPEIIAITMKNSKHLKFNQTFSDIMGEQLNRAVEQCHYPAVKAFVDSLSDISQSCLKMCHLQKALTIARNTQAVKQTDKQALSSIQQLLKESIRTYDYAKANALVEQERAVQGCQAGMA